MPFHHRKVRQPGPLLLCVVLDWPVAGVGAQIRHREANLDAIIAPIQDMYTLLTRYEVRLPKDELDAVSDLRYSWRKLNKQALDVSGNLAKLQVLPSAS